jgi:hypothetical protein
LPLVATVVRGEVHDRAGLRVLGSKRVVWGVLRFEPRPLLCLLLWAGSFLTLYGWYFMLGGPAGEFISRNKLSYVTAVGDLLYLEPPG